MSLTQDVSETYRRGKVFLTLLLVTCALPSLTISSTFPAPLPPPQRQLLSGSDQEAGTQLNGAHDTSWPSRSLSAIEWEDCVLQVVKYAVW